MLLQRRLRLGDRNLCVAAMFVLLVIACVLLRAIVLNPDIITQAIVAYTGEEITIYARSGELQDEMFLDNHGPQTDLGLGNASYSGDVALIDPVGSVTGQVGSLRGQSHNRGHLQEHRERRLPGCIIGGVRNSGMQTLADLLSLHPGVVLAQKEQHFFNRKTYFSKGLGAYRLAMPPSYSSQVTVEKSADYFASYWTPYRIHEMNSSLRLIFVVREPVRRLLAELKHLSARTNNTHSFKSEFTRRNGTRVHVESGAVQLSQYSIFTRRWLQFFKRDQLLFLNSDELHHNPVAESRKVETFLNLPPAISEKHVYPGSRKYTFCYRNLEKIEQCFGASSLKQDKLFTNSAIEPQLLELLTEFYKPFNREFFDLIGEDFGWPT